MTNPRILVVDDEVEICRSIRRLLRRSSLDVTFTTSPVQAIEILKQQRFVVVIADYRMPEMLGTDLLAEVARVSPSTLRLMLSACAEIDTLAATYDEGQIFRFVRKPWNDIELAANLMALVAPKAVTPIALSVTALEATQRRVW